MVFLWMLMGGLTVWTCRSAYQHGKLGIAKTRRREERHFSLMLRVGLMLLAITAGSTSLLYLFDEDYLSMMMAVIVCMAGGVSVGFAGVAGYRRRLRVGCRYCGRTTACFC